MATINGNSSNNTLNGTIYADTIRGAGGNDTIGGKGGNDYLYGDSGNDTLYGDAGNDRLWGGTGIDALWGGDGDDQIYGEGGNDYMKGGLGNDYLHGGANDDRLRGDDGNDTLHSGGGNDDLQGGAGNDTLINYARGSAADPNGTAKYDGGTGTDTLAFDVQGTFDIGDEASMVHVVRWEDGSGRIQYVTGWEEPGGPNVGSFSSIENFKLMPGSNSLYFYGFGNTAVTGGSYDDVLEVGDGNQVLTGGGGSDEFRFVWSPGSNSGHDTIRDFQKGTDHIGGNFWNDDFGEGWPVLQVSKAEHNGSTTYTSTRPDTGEVVHVLDVIGVTGLPDDPFNGYYPG